LSPLSVTRPFQPPPTPYAAGHRGADLAGAPGQPVRAAAAGRVSYAAVLAGRGVVVVMHGALRTTYEPVTALVHTGDAVAAGAPIGTLETGHAGCPVAACLHWGLLRDEVYLDPLAMLGPQPVRLLPLAKAGTAARAAVGVAGSAAATAPRPGGGGGPDAATWSLVAVAGAGLLVASGRRR
jgi:murein DD-endopeptidase MepM/ murein hydrolase activator NlpD